MRNRLIRALGASLLCGAVGATVPFVKLFRRGTRKSVDQAMQEIQAVCESSLQQTEQCRTDLNNALQLVSMLQSTVEEQRLKEKEKEAVIDGLMTEQRQLKHCLTAVEQKLQLSLAKENEKEQIIEGLRNEQRGLRKCLQTAENKLKASLDNERQHESTIRELEHENKQLQKAVETVQPNGEEQTMCTEAETETVEGVRRGEQDMCEGSTALGTSDAGKETKERACAGSASNDRQQSSAVEDTLGPNRRKRGSRRAKKRGAKHQVELSDKEEQQKCALGKTTQPHKNGARRGNEKRMALKERLDAELCEYLRSEAQEE